MREMSGVDSAKHRHYQGEYLVSNALKGLRCGPYLTLMHLEKHIGKYFKILSGVKVRRS